jgi:hypothetical protein
VLDILSVICLIVLIIVSPLSLATVLDGVSDFVDVTVLDGEWDIEGSASFPVVDDEGSCSSSMIGIGKISSFSTPTVNAAVVVAVLLPEIVLLLKVVLLATIGKACISFCTIGLGKISLISSFAAAPTVNAAVVVAVLLPEIVLLLKVVLLATIGMGCC